MLRVISVFSSTSHCPQLGSGCGSGSGAAGCGSSFGWSCPMVVASAAQDARNSDSSDSPIPDSSGTRASVGTRALTIADSIAGSRYAPISCCRCASANFGKANTKSRRPCAIDGLIKVVADAACQMTKVQQLGGVLPCNSVIWGCASG